MICSGTAHASFRTIAITLARSTFSSSVSFGRLYALESGSNALASSSTSVSSSFCSASAFSFKATISASTSAYFFFPTVRLPTIFPSAQPSAPTNALAPPPPGTGALVERISVNSSQLNFVKSISHLRWQVLFIHTFYNYNTVDRISV